MKHISILIPQGELILSSIIGPFKIFNAVNQYLIETGKRTQPMFTIDLVGLDNKSILYNGLFEIKTTKTFAQATQTDLIFIPAFNGDYSKGIERNQELIDWVREQYAKGAEVASFCVGAFILAATGLVNGKTCTTHWIATEPFKSLFPQVNLLPEKVITDEDGIYSSGGAFSFLNLIIYMIEKYVGREEAIYCSKLFEIEIDRVTQADFAIFRGQKAHNDTTIYNAQEYIEAHFHQKISVENLADKFALSRRNFIRRFKKATQNTPIEYIQRVKIEAAKKSLESTSQNVTEVMYQIGYSDSKAFRTVFKRYTGLSPVEYKNKYNRHLKFA